MFRSTQKAPRGTRLLPTVITRSLTHMLFTFFPFVSQFPHPLTLASWDQFLNNVPVLKSLIQDLLLEKGKLKSRHQVTVTYLLLYFTFLG